MMEGRTLNQNVVTKSNNEQPFSIRTNQQIHEAKKYQEEHTKWTWRWMKLHFHYFSYVADDKGLRAGEKPKEDKLSKRVSDFASQRYLYHYKEIGNNARDLGGYITKDGKYQIKKGLIIRSNNLHQLSNLGLKRLNQLNVTKIIDLRDLHEANQLPDNDKVINRVEVNPVYTRKGVNRSRNPTFRYGVIYRYHTLFFDNWHAMRAYHNSLVNILDNSGSTLYHCVEGRDRTGIVSVLLLAALGIDQHTIFNDYLLTDYYSHTKSYVRQYNQLVCFYRAVNKKFGNIYGYLHAIGITSHIIHQLRDKFLRPVYKSESLAK